MNKYLQLIHKVLFIHRVLVNNEEIKSVEFEEKKLSSEMILDEKIGILDIKVTTDKGTQINIEIQLLNQYNEDKPYGNLIYTCPKVEDFTSYGLA